MKSMATTKALGAGIFLDGSETIVDRREGHGDHGHYDARSHQYVEVRYHNGDSAAHYRTCNVERTDAYEENVYETNRHRNNVNRTVKETHSQSGQTTI